jgi:hypothetical protein
VSTILRHCGGWNDAKEQAGLATTYSTGTRVQEQPDGVELPDRLVWEELSQDQRWHYKHRDANAEQTRQRRVRLREWLRSRKTASDGCADCGELDPACLDFHHLDGTTKDCGQQDGSAWILESRHSGRSREMRTATGKNTTRPLTQTLLLVTDTRSAVIPYGCVWGKLPFFLVCRLRNTY